jgi:peptide/nickel transport system ATP-binding protein
MGQRIMIAMALAGDPDLIIADEPTSALDVMVRQECLALLDGLVSARGMGLLLISHDLDMVRTFSDRVLVMYRGRIVERLRSGDVGEATHPYTRALLEAQPRPHKRGKMLAVIDRTAPWARSDAP